MEARRHDLSRLHPDLAVATDEATREEIQRLRYEVYYEECRHETDGLDHARRLLRDEGDEDATLAYVRKEGRVVGTVRIDFGADGNVPAEFREWFALDRFADFPEATLSFVTRIMVDREWRSSPVLGLLIRACYELGRRRGVRFAFCGSSSHLVWLYEAMGFQRYKENIVVPGFATQIPYVLVTEDVEHLKAVRSPFLKQAQRFENDDETRRWFLTEFPREIGLVPERMVPAEELRAYFDERLRDVDSELLRGLDDDAVAAALGSGTILRCAAGERIAAQGEPAEDMILVLEGQVEAIRHHDAGHYSVGEHAAGEVVGASNHLDGSRRDVELVAASDAIVVSLSRGTIRRALRRMPEAWQRVHRSLDRIAVEELSHWADAIARLACAA